MKSRADVETERYLEAREIFSRHEISSRSECGSRWTLVRRRENGVWEHDMHCEIAVLSDGFIVVHGDFDTCAWKWYGTSEPHAVVARTAGASGAYLIEKARKGLDDPRLVEERVGEVLAHELTELRDEWEESHGEPLTEHQREAIDEAIENADGAKHDECEAIVRELLDEREPVIDWEESLGYVTTDRLIRGHVAVSRLHELLVKEEP